jgi:hypothetical protein
MSASPSTSSIPAPPPPVQFYAALISDAEQRATEQASGDLHVCVQCACSWCGKLPAMAPVPPTCVGWDVDHKAHSMFWRLYAARQPISAELTRFADDFEDEVNAHFASLEPTGEDWSTREVLW